MERPTLIYVYDPLCGWCYTFHPVVHQLAEKFKERLSIQVKPGGLAIGEQARTIRDGYSFIPQASKQAETVTGVKFGRNFYLLAEEGSYFINSEPPCIAQMVVNKLAPGHALQFAGDMQNAFFRDGKSLNKWETFEELLKPLPVDLNECRKLFESDEMKQETYEQFDWCKKAGATGFPALLLKIGDEIGVMSRGYRPFDTVESHLHHLLNNVEKLQNS
ncbi:MAG: DsbA family protein [Balneolaceae bacterium]